MDLVNMQLLIIVLETLLSTCSKAGENPGVALCIFFQIFEGTRCTGCDTSSNYALVLSVPL